MGQCLGPFSFYAFKYLNKCIGVLSCSVISKFDGLVFWSILFFLAFLDPKLRRKSVVFGLAKPNLYPTSPKNTANDFAAMCQHIGPTTSNPKN